MRSFAPAPLFACLLLLGCSTGSGAAVDADANDDAAPADTASAADVALQDTPAPVDTAVVFPDTHTPPDTTTRYDARWDTGAPPACEDASDCVFCPTPKPPDGDPGSCFCPSCPVLVLARTECRANAGAWDDLCNGRDAAGKVCPPLDCRDPGPTACEGGVCVVPKG